MLIDMTSMIDHVLQREVIVHSMSDSETLGLYRLFIGYERVQ